MIGVDVAKNKLDIAFADQQIMTLAVKGIGKISAYALIALLPELGKVSNKEIAALVGVAPQQRER